MSNQLSLLDEIASKDFLLEAWGVLNKLNKSSRGLSNTSIRDFSERLNENILEISNSLLAGEYKFSPVKAVTIKKNNVVPKKDIDPTIETDEFEEIEGLRPLRISEIKDRLVQKALAIKLDELLTPIYNLDNECSFAYRKEKNVEKAIEKMAEYYNLGYNIILEADIEKFFDTVDKARLLKEIQSKLPDPTINALLDSSLTQQIGNRHTLSEKIFETYFFETENGIPQGNALSPLLANIYLSQFDQIIIKNGLKMVRYADDFIILCKSIKEAENAYEIAKLELENNLGLHLHPLEDPKNEDGKSKIVNPVFHKFSFLSIRFDGKRQWVKEKKVRSFIDKINQATDVESLKRDKKPIQLLTIMTSVRNILEGWIAAFWFVDLSNEIKEIDKHINRNLYLVFKELGFKLEKSSLERISFKGNTNKLWMLNNTQRVSTGIPFADFIWEKLKKKKQKKIVKE